MSFWATIPKYMPLGDRKTLALYVIRCLQHRVAYGAPGFCITSGQIFLACHPRIHVIFDFPMDAEHFPKRLVMKFKIFLPICHTGG